MQLKIKNNFKEFNKEVEKNRRSCKSNGEIISNAGKRKVKNRTCIEKLGHL